MNCLLSGAIVRIGGAQKRADGVAGAKYSQKNSQPQEQRNSKRLDAYSHSGTQLFSVTS